MKFRIDRIGGLKSPDYAYIELNTEEGWIRLRAGYGDSKAGAAINTGISRSNALALAGALNTLAESLEG